ncbi:MAG: T9SS type A sorting domain-containing protein [Bacteroidales bacterium]|nr:T9SS type A sorting domain-containing protein [Bacteroidales bacterium]
MKRKALFSFLAAIFIAGQSFVSILKAAEGDSVNVAIIATASTSYVSDWETLDAVNDGYTPSNSNDKTQGAYGNWPNPNSYQWVQYTWDQDFILKSVEIYWFDDKGGVLTPDTAFIQLYDNGDWETLDSIPVPCLKDTFNYADLGDIAADRIRVMFINGSESTGILEFRVWGTGLSGSVDIERPTSPGNLVIQEKYPDSARLAWGPSTDDYGIVSYHVSLNDTMSLVTSDTTLLLTGLSPEYLYYASVRTRDAADNLSRAFSSLWFSTGEDTLAGKTFLWPEYTTSLSYDFRDEFPALEMPTQDLDDCPEVVGTQSDRWWTFKWGPEARSLVTEAAITPMLERMNTDFAYFRDTLGWPPDKRAKRGYRSAIYLYGSGLCTDDEDSTALGGWQGTIWHEGESWPMVLLSYYPVYCYDPSCGYSDRSAQRGAVVHEGIHSVLADLPGAKKAAWFQEGGNTWLQQEAAARQSGDYSSMGFLNGATFIAPFMPIECYSGWLQDNSFGGPSAEGVNRYNSSGTQLCTWRNYLGGTQYGNAFPVFVSDVFGPKSVAWIWRNCPGRVLEGMADSLGDMQIRRLIMEYKAKQALVDMGPWTDAIRDIMNSYFYITVRSEWTPTWLNPDTWFSTPYARTQPDTILNALAPEYRTTPGWSGANQIPLNVEGMGDTVVVNFIPLGKNMTCQLCYRAEDGSAVYGIPVSEGTCTLILDKKPANNIVIAVIANTDYVYEGEETRTAHFDYRLQLVKGISKKASVYRKWFNHEDAIEDVVDPEWWIEDTPDGVEKTISEQAIKIYPNPAHMDASLRVAFSKEVAGTKRVHVITLQGQNIHTVESRGDEVEIDLSDAAFEAGIYFIVVQSDNQHYAERVIIQ